MSRSIVRGTQTITGSKITWDDWIAEDTQVPSDFDMTALSLQLQAKIKELSE